MNYFNDDIVSHIGTFLELSDRVSLYNAIYADHHSKTLINDLFNTLKCHYCDEMTGTIEEVGSNITKFIRFKTPITNIPGHQSITYCLDTIEKKLYKRDGKCGERIKSKIVKELKRLIQ